MLNHSITQQMKTLSTLLLLALSLPSLALAQEEDAEEDIYAPEKGTFSLTFENDVFSGSDRSYTNGVRASWVTGADKIPSLLRPFANAIPTFPENGDKRVSYALGQSMFTPDDITDYTLRTDDRPYAGWLYGSMGLVSDTGEQLDVLSLTLGIVGPASMAQHTQRIVHQHVTGSPEPRGWYHQLDNEPGMILSYERKWRSYYAFDLFGYGVDATPSLGASLGNVYTAAETGFTVRLGKYLPADYGPPRVRPALSGSDFFVPTEGFGWYVFAGAQGRFVAHNIFLDGNTFSSSHSVDKNNWVGDLQAGIAVTYDNTRITLSHVYRTKEYELQDEADSFSALTLSYQF